MVKLEGASGSVVLVNPSTVTLIAEATQAGFSVVHVTSGVYSATVKGTPEEVHARLFPQEVASASPVAPGVRVASLSALEVLEWVSQCAMNGPVVVPDYVVKCARKALGRE